ncbi:MAG: hypothetical protein AB8G14_01480 [Ilumatobacter sp.]
MTNTVRLRSATWFATGVVLTLVASLMISQAWRVDAATVAQESIVVPVNPPVRVLDTRDSNEVGLAGPFTSPDGQKLTVTGSIPTSTGPQTVVPDGATGVLLNVTAVRPTNNGFISVRPGDATGSPETSNLNVTAGTNVPNAVTVGLPVTGANAGQIDITYVSGDAVGPTTEVLIDVVGYLTESNGLSAVEARVDTLEAAPRTFQFNATGTATSAVDIDTARPLATSLPLGTVGQITFTAKCLHDSTVDEVSAEIYAATSTDGAVMEGTDDLPTETEYLLTTTPEIDRQVDVQTANGDRVSLGEAEHFIIQADGAMFHFVTSLAVKGSSFPAGDGPLPPGNSCQFNVSGFA